MTGSEDGVDPVSEFRLKAVRVPPVKLDVGCAVKLTPYLGVCGYCASIDRQARNRPAPGPGLAAITAVRERVARAPGERQVIAAEEQDGQAVWTGAHSVKHLVTRVVGGG
ncbi:MAG: hypothetical protein WB952_17310 [Terriglobales bacterium]